MTELDKTNVISNNKKNRIVNNRNKLLEIYALVSSLIITSIQTTSSLIAINTSVNETVYKNTILTTKAIIGSSNIAFFLFIFLLLIYYTKMFDNDLLFTAFLIIGISIFFSCILTNFVDLCIHLSWITYSGLLFLISTAILLTLVQTSILTTRLENLFSNLLNYIYHLIPRVLKSDSSKQVPLRIWKSIILVVTFYIIYYIFMTILLFKNYQLYDTLTSLQIDILEILWIISLVVLFKIFRFLLTL